MGRPRRFDEDVVVEAAMQAFWTHGYANTSPAQLAECTGVGKGSLYHAFGSKRQLFVRALVRYGRQGVAFAEDVLAQPGTTRERVGAYLRACVEADLASPTRRGCLAVRTATEFGGDDGEIAGTLRGIEERIVGALAARIDQGRRDGDVRPDVDQRAVARFLFNTGAGLRVLARTNDAPALDRIVEVALTVL